MKIINNKVKQINLFDQEKIQEEIKKTYNHLYLKIYQRNLTIDNNQKRIYTNESYKSPRNFSINQDIGTSIQGTDRSEQSDNKTIPRDSNIPIMQKQLATASKRQSSLINNGNKLESELADKLRNLYKIPSNIESRIFIPNIKTIKVDKHLMLKLNNEIRKKNSKYTNLKLNKSSKIEDGVLYEKNNTKLNEIKKYSKKEKNTFPSIDLNLNYYTPQNKNKKYIDYSNTINRKIHKQQDIPIDKSQNIYLSDYIYHVEKKFLKPSDENRSFNYLHRESAIDCSNHRNIHNNVIDKNNDCSMEDEHEDESTYYQYDKYDIKSKIPLNIYIEKGSRMKK